jgi:steroid 5-alpha reductase family enzyme
MLPEMSSWALTALALAGAMVALWALSLRLRDSSIVDIFWGVGFVGVAWISALASPGGAPRARLAVGLTTAWGLRLAGYLASRNLGKGEDPRYAAMRRRHGEAWPVRSLFIVFGLQGVLLWVVSLPVQAAVRAPPSALGALDLAGAALWVVGLAFESVGDYQLARWKRDPENRGKVMDRGLWRYTRHPNYFGDFLVWWGLFALAAGAGAWWTALSPALMSVLLRRVSGVPLLEKSMRRRPGYDEYVRRTSAFFPWPPREA